LTENPLGRRHIFLQQQINTLIHCGLGFKSRWISSFLWYTSSTDLYWYINMIENLTCTNCSNWWKD